MPVTATGTRYPPSSGRASIFVYDWRVRERGTILSPALSHQLLGALEKRVSIAPVRLVLADPHVLRFRCPDD